MCSNGKKLTPEPFPICRNPSDLASFWLYLSPKRGVSGFVSPRPAERNSPRLAADNGYVSRKRGKAAMRSAYKTRLTRKISLGMAFCILGILVPTFAQAVTYHRVSKFSTDSTNIEALRGALNSACTSTGEHAILFEGCAASSRTIPLNSPIELKDCKASKISIDNTEEGQAETGCYPANLPVTLSVSSSFAGDSLFRIRETSASGTTQIVMKKIWFSNSPGDGLRIEGEANNVSVSELYTTTIKGAAVHILDNANNIQVTDNYFYRSDGGGVKLSGNAHHNRIYGNDFSNDVYYDDAAYSKNPIGMQIVGSAHDNEVESNTFYGNGVGMIIGENATNNTLEVDYFTTNTTGIKFSGSASGNSVTSCTFERGASTLKHPGNERAIALEGNAADLGNTIGSTDFGKVAIQHIDLVPAGVPANTQTPADPLNPTSAESVVLTYPYNLSISVEVNSSECVSGTSYCEKIFRISGTASPSAKKIRVFYAEGAEATSRQYGVKSFNISPKEDGSFSIKNTISETIVQSDAEANYSRLQFSELKTGDHLTAIAYDESNSISEFSDVVVLETYVAPVADTDADGDGYVDENDGGDDCNDADPAINPGATELCTDGIDNNCDDLTDAEDTASCPVIADNDADNDGYDDANAGGDDCNDADPAVNPGATELCTDGIDNNCDGLTDTQDSVTCPVVVDNDADNDGYDDANAGGDDCNDASPAVNPGAVEICDGLDNNCDGQIDEGVLSTFFQDRDQDAYGGQSASACTAPTGYVSSGGDCNDLHSLVNPGQSEICSDGLDNNCNGLTDETNCSIDSDGDGYGTADGDCDDSNGNINPGETEICTDSIDNNCNGQTDSHDSACTVFDLDQDDDGFTPNEGDCNDYASTINPNATEKCDSLDNDCDGKVDELESCDRTSDNDGDGFTPESDDCNDTNADVFPGAPEDCDGIDDDCNGAIDDDAACESTDDGDGDGFTPSQGDCNDADPAINPDASEDLDDGIDNNCDGSVDTAGSIPPPTEPGSVLSGGAGGGCSLGMGY